jgi:hypothetical protein
LAPGLPRTILRLKVAQFQMNGSVPHPVAPLIPKLQYEDGTGDTLRANGSVEVNDDCRLLVLTRYHRSDRSEVARGPT